jgi:mannose-6-phosphate isomerase-like protein (cupin superfamily)
VLSNPTRPEIGLELVNPVAGTTTVFTATAESTGGAYVEVEVTYPPNSAPPPRHLHPAQDEQFTLLSGSMHGQRGDEPLDVAAPGGFDVPRGTPHLMASGADGAVVRWRTSPALRTGEMFVALWQVARDHDWAPDGMTLFGVVSQYGDEFCLC